MTKKRVEKKIIKPRNVGLKEKVIVPVFTKMEISTNVPLPSDHIRCIVLKDYKGMEGDCYKGDIQDLPERRYKSLSFRGVVKKYDGKSLPNILR